MDTPKTPYSEVCDILGELWLDYKGDEAFEDFIQYNDMGLPAAYMISQGIFSSTPLAEQYVMETWELFLDALGLEDTGWESLDDMLEAALNVEEE